MKKFKIGIAFLSVILVMLVSLGAQASSNFALYTDVFSGIMAVDFASSPNEPVSIQVIPVDADIERLDDISYMLSTVAYCNEKEADSSGNVRFSFPLKNSGEYLVRVHTFSRASVALTETIDFTSLSDAETIWNGLVSLPDENLPQLLKILDIKDELILNLKDDSDLHLLIKSYNSLGAFTKENADELFKQITSDCQDIITLRNLLDKIANLGNSTQVKGIVTNSSNADLLGISEYLSRYNSLTNTQIADLAVAGKTFTKSEFQAAFLAGIEAAEKAQAESLTNNKPSSPSISGVGGGSLGGAVSTPTPITPTVSASPFSDISGVEWAKDAISALYSKGIINGKSTNQFAPDDYITREEFVKIAVGLMNVEPVSQVSSFTDVDASAWYAPYVNTAYNAGVINGYSENVFGVGEFISRQDVAVILNRIHSVKNSNNKLVFADNTDIADYAKSAVDNLSSAGVINGSNGNFMPKSNCTRAEVACMVYRIMNLMGEGK